MTEASDEAHGAEDSGARAEPQPKTWTVQVWWTEIRAVDVEIEAVTAADAIRIAKEKEVAGELYAEWGRAETIDDSSEPSSYTCWDTEPETERLSEEELFKRHGPKLLEALRDLEKLAMTALTYNFGGPPVFVDPENHPIMRARRLIAAFEPKES